MNLLFEKAEKARQRSRFKIAQGLYESLLNKRLEKAEKAEALLGLADVERIQGLFPEAMRHYRAAGYLFGKVAPSLSVDAQVGWALAARAMGRPKAALQELKKALAYYRKQSDPSGEAFVHWALGGTFRIAGDMRQGLKELQTALRMFKSLKESEGISYVCCALGGIYRMLGRYAESEKYYREANRRMRQRGDTFGIAYSYCGLGNVQRMAERFEAALPFYRKAEKLYGKIGDRVSYAYTLWSLGTTHKMLGRYKEALRDFAKADKLFRETGDTRGNIYTFLGFSEIETLAPHIKFKSDIHKYFQLKKNFKASKEFVWENLHVSTSIKLGFVGLAKMIADTKNLKIPTSQVRKLKRSMKKVVREIGDLYKKAGSKFYPKSFPVNWP